MPKNGMLIKNKKAFLDYLIKMYDKMLTEYTDEQFSITLTSEIAICLIFTEWRKVGKAEWKRYNSDHLEMIIGRFPELGVVIEQQLKIQPFDSSYMRWRGDKRLQIEKRLETVQKLKAQLFPVE